MPKKKNYENSSVTLNLKKSNTNLFQIHPRMHNNIYITSINDEIDISLTYIASLFTDKVWTDIFTP